MYVEAHTLALLGPEILLVAAATLLYVGGAFIRQREAWSLVALASYVIAGGWIIARTYGADTADAAVLSGPISATGMSVCLRLLSVVVGIAFTLVAAQQTDKLLATEYLGSLMLVVVGLMLVSGANELVLLFLGFELISIPTYVLLFLGRRDRASGEATMKYFFLSILSSTLLLFGLALLFGMAGTTTIQGTAAAPGIHEVLLKNAAATEPISVTGKVTVNGQPLNVAVSLVPSDDDKGNTVTAAVVGGKFEIPASRGVTPGKYRVTLQTNPTVWDQPTADATKSLLALAPLALVLLLAGLGFKLTAAPFHFYAPDVYQGTTNANAGLLAVAPKIAGVVGLIRLVVIALPVVSDYAWQLALVLAIITMTIGNVCALWQNNVRRLMAYSSIAHGGYLLLGLAAAAGATAFPQLNVIGGVTALVFYVVVYSLASLGTFTALAYLGSQRRDVQTVHELAGLGKSQPIAAAVIAVCMFSLAGIPPLAGFWGKFSLFGSALQIAIGDVDRNVAIGFSLLLIAGALNAAIAAAYYLRLVSVMFFQSATEETPAAGGLGALSAAVMCGALVVLAGIAPGPIMHLAGQAEEQLLKPAVASASATSVSAEPASALALRALPTK